MMKKVIIFGTGQAGQLLLEYFLRHRREIKVTAFADNDRTKQGQLFSGLPIKKPSEIDFDHVDAVVIASVHFVDIRHQLIRENTLPTEKILQSPPCYSDETRKLCQNSRCEEAALLADQVERFWGYGEDCAALIRAEIAYVNQDWSKASQLYALAIDALTETVSFDVYFRSARAFRKNSWFEKAAEVIKKGLDIKPDSTLLGYERAELDMDRRDCDSALTGFQFILQKLKQETPAKVYIRISQLFRKLLQFDEAERIIKQGLDNYATDLWLLVEKSEIYRELERWSEAIACLELIKEKETKATPLVVFLRLILLYKRTDIFLDKKVDVISTGLSLYPDSIQLRLEWAEHLVIQNEWAHALSVYESILHNWKQETPARVYTRISQLYRKLLKFIEAQVCINQALEHDSNNIWFWLEKAEIFRELERWSEAIACLERVRKQEASSTPLIVFQRLIQLYRRTDNSGMVAKTIEAGQCIFPFEKRLDGPRYRYMTTMQRAYWKQKFAKINFQYRSMLKSGDDTRIPHADWHILVFVDALLGLQKNKKGCVVEAGVFNGVSSAKFSLVVKKLKRALYLFDSFEGLPDNDEQHQENIMGKNIKGWFSSGAFGGNYHRFVKTLQICGEYGVCHIRKGWFEDTLPCFKEPVVAAYLDCDLASSTRTCLQNIYPLLVPGGFIVSQDGDFPLVIDVFRDNVMWKEIVGNAQTKLPRIEGLGYSKMIVLQKPDD